MTSLQEIASFVGTSFGPFGRSKVIRLSTGVCLISRDGGLLLDALIATITPNDNPFVKLILSAAKKLEDSFGDGGIKLVMIISEFLQRITAASISPFSVFNIAYPDHSKLLIRRRLCVSMIASVIARHQWKIIDSLVEAKLWVSVNVANPLIMTFARKIVFGALKSMAKGEVLNVVQNLLNSLLFQDMDAANLHSNILRMATDLQDRILICTNSSVASTQSTLVNAGEVIVSGRILDNGQPIKVDALVVDKYDDVAGEEMQPHHPNCSRKLIRALLITDPTNMYLTANSDEDDSPRNITITLTTNMQWSDSSISSMSSRAVQLLIRELVDHRVGLLVCNARIDGQVRFELTKGGIVVIDDVSPNHLSLLARAGNCQLWDCADSFISANTAPSHNKFLHFEAFQRVFMSSDPHLKFFGVHRESSNHREFELVKVRKWNPEFPSQVLIFGATKYERDLIARLLTKAVRILDRCFVVKRDIRLESSAGQIPQILVAPGNGVDEFIFSALWRQVADYVEHGNIAMRSVLPEGHASTCDFSKALQPAVRYLHRAISDEIDCRFVDADSFGQANWRLHVVDICRHFGESFAVLNGNLLGKLPSNTSHRAKYSHDGYLSEVSKRWAAGIEEVTNCESDFETGSSWSSGKLAWEVMMSCLHHGHLYLRTDWQPIATHK